MRRYIDQLETQEKQRQETLESWEAYEQTGKTIDHDAMVEWLESWETIWRSRARLQNKMVA